MRSVLFAWRRFTPPFLIGGAEVTQQLLAEEFAGAGWQVTYLGAHEAPWDGSSVLADMRYQLAARGVEYTYDKARDMLRYRWNGVDCRSVRQVAVLAELDTVLREPTPELVVTSQEGSAELAVRAGRVAPVVGWIHSVSRTGTEVLRGHPRYALVVSRFVQSRLGASPDTTAILCYPPFTVSGVDVPDASARTDDLLMVNPVPAKGAQLVTELARQLPERRFTLVEGWWDTSDEFIGADNVRYVRRTYEMDRLYRSHRLLLVPSVVEDAFPRVIIEAGLAGLPTIGSDRGGIAEAIEDGGLVIPSGEVLAWAAAIRSLDGPAWAECARRARERASRLVRSCLAELAAAGVIAAT
jgi:glycosyltransferase involved in cell wall biosynthesis